MGGRQLMLWLNGEPFKKFEAANVDVAWVGLEALLGTSSASGAHDDSAAVLNLALEQQQHQQEVTEAAVAATEQQSRELQEQRTHDAALAQLQRDREARETVSTSQAWHVLLENVMRRLPELQLLNRFVPCRYCTPVTPIQLTSYFPDLSYCME